MNAVIFRVLPVPINIKACSKETYGLWLIFALADKNFESQYKVRSKIKNVLTMGLVFSKSYLMVQISYHTIGNARRLYHRLRNPDLNRKQEKIKNNNASCIELLLGCRPTPPSPPPPPPQKDRKREASQSESLEDTIFCRLYSTLLLHQIPLCRRRNNRNRMVDKI